MWVHHAGLALAQGCCDGGFASIDIYADFMGRSADPTRNLIPVRFSISRYEAGGPDRDRCAAVRAGVESAPQPRLSQIECTYEQMDTSLHAVCGALVEILGPVFWAMLLVTFVHAELFGN
jgi:hypothetical protein